MIEQQYYGKSPENCSFSGFDHSVGQCTLACSPGLDKATINDLDSVINSQISPSLTGGSITYMSADSKRLVIGRTYSVDDFVDYVPSGREPYFIHNYVIKTDSPEWEEMVRDADHLVFTEFEPTVDYNGFFETNTSCASLQGVKSIDVADVPNCGVLELLRSLKISVDCYAAMLNDIIVSMSGMLTAGERSVPLAVIFPGSADEQRHRALLLLRCLLEGLPYGARRFFGYHILYRGGSPTAGARFIAIDNSQSGIAGTFSSSLYDFARYPSTGKRNPLMPLDNRQAYFKTVVRLLETKGSCSKLHDRIEEYSTLDNCHFQLYPYYLNAAALIHFEPDSLASSSAAAQSDYKPASVTEYEKSLSALFKEPVITGKLGGRSLYFNLFRTYVLRFRSAKTNTKVIEEFIGWLANFDDKAALDTLAALIAESYKPTGAAGDGESRDVRAQYPLLFDIFSAGRNKYGSRFIIAAAAGAKDYLDSYYCSELSGLSCADAAKRANKHYAFARDKSAQEIINSAFYEVTASKLRFGKNNSAILTALCTAAAAEDENPPACSTLNAILEQYYFTFDRDISQVSHKDADTLSKIDLLAVRKIFSGFLSSSQTGVSLENWQALYGVMAKIHSFLFDKGHLPAIQQQAARLCRNKNVKKVLESWILRRCSSHTSKRGYELEKAGPRYELIYLMCSKFSASDRKLLPSQADSLINGLRKWLRTNRDEQETFFEWLMAEKKITVSSYPPRESEVFDALRKKLTSSKDIGPVFTLLLVIALTIFILFAILSENEMLDPLLEQLRGCVTQKQSTPSTQSLGCIAAVKTIFNMIGW